MQNKYGSYCVLEEVLEDGYNLLQLDIQIFNTCPWVSRFRILLSQTSIIPA